jgi:hypothetical protein
MQELTPKHTKVRVAQMAREYREMFSGASGIVTLVFVGLCVLGWALLTYAAGTVQMLGFFLMFFIGIPLSYMLLSPLLARIVFPIVIGFLELLRILIRFVQYMLDHAVIGGMTENSLYPSTPDDDHQSA